MRLTECYYPFSLNQLFIFRPDYIVSQFINSTQKLLFFLKYLFRISYVPATIFRCSFRILYIIYRIVFCSYLKRQCRDFNTLHETKICESSLHDLKPDLANFFCKRPGSKYFQFSWPYEQMARFQLFNSAVVQEQPQTTHKQISIAVFQHNFTYTIVRRVQNIGHGFTTPTASFSHKFS